MKQIHHEVFIQAPVETVWDTMLSDATYRDWTSVFDPHSRFEGSWEEGSEIHFLGSGPDGSEEGGMASRIAANRPHEFISIEHLGLINNGVVDTQSDEVKKWAPAFENYTFTQADGGTELAVDMDIDEAHAAMFEELWPKALQRLKELAEEAR